MIFYRKEVLEVAKKLGLHRELTTREKTILDFIRNKIWQDGFPPTVREICTAVGLRSTSTVHGYLARLEEMGMIKKDPASSRAIEVVDDNSWRKKKNGPYADGWRCSCRRAYCSR